MKSSELFEIRLACLTEAGKLKQCPETLLATEGKSIVEIAKEFEAYVLGKQIKTKKT